MHTELKISDSIRVHIGMKHRRIGFFCTRGMSLTPSPPLTLQFFDFNTLLLRLFHRSLLELEVMSSTPPPMRARLILIFVLTLVILAGTSVHLLVLTLISVVFFGNFAFADFFGGLVTSDFEFDSSGSSSDDTSGHRRRQRRWLRCRRPNRLFRVESVKKSSWYRNFTAPGETRDLTHELSSCPKRVGSFGYSILASEEKASGK